MSRYTLNKYISRLVAVLLCLVLLCGAMPAALATEVTVPPEITEPAQVAYSGTCGENLTWVFANGTLTITGSGDMDNFPESTMAPWYHLRNQILWVELPEGLTSVGNLAFYQCVNLKIVVIPDSVTRIGSYAFANCERMELLNLGNGVETIEECAFTDCYALTSLRLPDSLKTIGVKGFYRCETITAITVPKSVINLGISAFAYCENLVYADVRASITSVPEYLFYGCDKLSSVTLSDMTTEISDYSFRQCNNLGAVYYGGSNMSQEEIRNRVSEIVPDFEDNGYVGIDSMTSSSTSSEVTENDDGTITQTNTKAEQGEDSTVTTNVTNTHPEDSLTGDISAEIIVTVEGENGWKEATDAVQDSLKELNDTITNTGSTSETPEITVYVKGDGSVDQDFVDALADRDVILNIITQDGSVWKIDTTDMNAGSGAYDLRCSVTAGDEALCQELGTSASFRVKFMASAELNAQVMIRIGAQYAMQSATLIQRQGKELIRRQTTVVDREGYAHFYLASVDDKSEYYIAMNLPDAQQEAIVPQELNAAYGAPVNYQPIQYEITGRTSSWGMNINQVTWIMVGFLAVTVITVGFVMFFLNKRRLAMGYVPEWDDEDEE